MLDLKMVREQADFVKEKLSTRGVDGKIVDAILELDKQWRELKTEGDQLRAAKNKISLEIAERKKQKKDASDLMKKLAGVPKKISENEEEAGALEKKMNGRLLLLPNLPHESVPEGEDENGNVEVRKFGEPREIGFKPLTHYELGEKLGLLDFERGVKLGGHRFCVMKGELAALERAVTSFFLDVAVERGYTEHWVPYLVKPEIMQGTGQLPKFEEELYKCERDGLYLIPTAEVPLTNLHANEILEEAELPKNYCAFTPCFRREAGAYQKDIKGMMRQHQFDKVELVKITTPETSFEELEGMVEDAEEVLKRLELPYRVMQLCAGEMGFSSAKTYDVEVWLPSQGKYREISSCSNCTCFQACRMNARFRRKGGLEFVHTLNGSGVAVGRTVIAIMENCQNKDGTISVPKALQKYLNGKKKIG
ncbi:serine--tRNA ligase [Candidatus Micrarchaeota archaeon]|nr:serine--tRNA ligase [Candidatus Micrarchaeota archaeon]